MESLTGNTVIGPPFLPADGPRFCKQFIIKNPHDVTYATAVLNLELVAASRVARIFGHTPPNNEPLVSIIHFLAIVCLESIVRFKVTSTTALFNYFFFFFFSSSLLITVLRHVFHTKYTSRNFRPDGNELKIQEDDQGQR